MLKSKPFGIRGEISPSVVEIDEDFYYGNDKDFFVSIHDGVLEISYDKEENNNRAHKIGMNFVYAWSFRNFKINVDFNQSWKSDLRGNKTIEISVYDSVSVKDRVITTTVVKKDMSYSIKQKSDSYNFSNDFNIVKKAEVDETLFLVLGYFNDEVLSLNHRQVMSGTHKIIEQITKYLGNGNNQTGRELLSKLAGCNKQHIDDLMTFVQNGRHSKIWLDSKRSQLLNKRQIFSMEECIFRVKRLINAYISFIS